MVGMQREDCVERLNQNRIRLIAFRGIAKHHVHEVRRVVQIIAWIHERLTNVVFVGHCHDGWQFGDKSIE
jgi:hypothetical protein